MVVIAVLLCHALKKKKRKNKRIERPHFAEGAKGLLASKYMAASVALEQEQEAGQ